MSEQQIDHNQLIEQRIKKVQELKNNGINPYPIRFFPNSYSLDLIENYDSLVEKKLTHKLGGRLHSKRVMGKASFGHLKDKKGTIQFYITKDDVGEQMYSLFKSLDLGDQIGIEGHLFKTQKGEISLHIQNLTLLAKCIRPLPVVKEKDGIIYDAFVDKEQRYRMRYVDLVVNDSVRETFVLRSKIISEIRNFFISQGFLEVETPMMQPIAGGALAKPFITHHNALNMQLYLRIAPELYLKRLIVGGMDRVFELNRNFRNEGISIKHNPEFTMLEAYMAYGDMETMLQLTEKLFEQVAKSIGKWPKLKYGDYEIDLSTPWRRAKYVEIIREHTGLDFSKISTLEEAQNLAKEIHVDVSKCNTVW